MNSTIPNQILLNAGGHSISVPIEIYNNWSSKLKSGVVSPIQASAGLIGDTRNWVAQHPNSYSSLYANNLANVAPGDLQSNDMSFDPMDFNT